MYPNKREGVSKNCDKTLELQDFMRYKDVREPGEHPENLPDGYRLHAQQLTPLWNVGPGERQREGVRWHGYGI